MMLLSEMKSPRQQQQQQQQQKKKKKKKKKNVTLESVGTEQESLDTPLSAG